MTFVPNFFVGLGAILGNSAGIPRLKLLAAYCKICIRFMVWVRMLHQSPKSERVCGYRVSLPAYDAFFYLFHEIFVHQQYFFQSARREPYVIDCGSNIGLSVLYFKLLYPDAIVTAIEPSPNAISFLRSNVQRNRLKNVHINEVAVWSRNETMRLYFQKAQPASSTASLLKHNLAATDQLPYTEVACVPLSDFVHTTVDLLKLDVEGAELPVMQQLCESNKFQYVERLLVEFHHAPGDSALPTFLRLLEAQGLCYRLSHSYVPVAPSTLDQASPQGIMISAWRENPSPIR